MLSVVNIRSLLAVTMAILVVGIAIFVFRGSPRTSLPEPSVKNVSKSADIALTNARFNEIRNGVVEWELVSERVEYDKNGDTAHLSNVRMNFFQQKKSGLIVVTAKSGLYSAKKRNVSLKDSVHVESSDGARFDTDLLDYNAARSVFLTASPITFQQDRLLLNAVGMDMDARRQKVHFHTLVDSTIAGVMPQTGRSQ